MRVHAALAVLLTTLPMGVAAAPSSQNPQLPGASTASHCPRTTSYLADKSGLYRGQPLKPRKLTELPPATTYMAVFRHIDGCEVPLTMVEYRNSGRR
jgi:hypothetical protein